MREKRMHWLANTINKHKFKTGAEVGAATGITTEHVLSNCSSLKKLYIADDWRPVGGPGHRWNTNNMEEFFRKKFGKDKRVQILKGLSWDMAVHVEDKSLDFVFIDASHDYESVLKDLNAWTPKVKEGGLMCGHDLHSPGVVQAVLEKYLRYVDVGVDHVWVVQI